MDLDRVTRYQRFETRAEYRSALVTALECAVREVRILESDGVFAGFEQPAFATVLDELLRRRGDAQVDILVRDAGFLERSCPRVNALMTTHGARLRVLRPDPPVPSFEKSLVLVDDSVVLRRPNANLPVAYWDCDEQAISATRRLFEEIVSQSTTAYSVTPTGL
ncbi:MAG: hypothetical protein H6934_09980 [Burkholderiaceae bacterium]|nr:hypothetical protein [Burkholderiaceae bacterium]